MKRLSLIFVFLGVGAFAQDSNSAAALPEIRRISQLNMHPVDSTQFFAQGDVLVASGGNLCQEAASDCVWTLTAKDTSARTRITPFAANSDGEVGILPNVAPGQYQFTSSNGGNTSKSVDLQVFRIRPNYFQYQTAGGMKFVMWGSRTTSYGWKLPMWSPDHLEGGDDVNIQLTGLGEMLPEKGSQGVQHARAIVTVRAEGEEFPVTFAGSNNGNPGNVISFHVTEGRKPFSSFSVTITSWDGAETQTDELRLSVSMPKRSR